MSNAILTEALLDAQAGVLGIMLIDGSMVGDVVMRVGAEDFIEPRYKLIFQAMNKLYQAGEPVDGITVNEKLGGNYNAILVQLMELTTTTANVMAYVDWLKEKSRQHKLQDLGQRLTQAVNMEEAEELVSQINQCCTFKSGVKITTMAECFESFVDRIGGGNTPEYLTWGMEQLNKNLYVDKGDLVVIGGYPSAGKTALALQVVYHLAMEKRVGYFYLENNDKKLFERLVSAVTKIAMTDIKRNNLDEEACKKILEHRPKLAQPCIEFVDAVGMSVSDISSTANAKNYDIVVVDYLQKVSGERGKKTWSDFERVSAVSSDLQILGKRSGKTVIALSQLSRAEKDGNKVKTPSMSSLRQSGQIEQDADVVMLLYPDDTSNLRSRTVKIAKNKEGESGLALQLEFDGATQTFAPMKKSISTQISEMQKELKAQSMQITLTELGKPDKDLPF